MRRFNQRSPSTVVAVDLEFLGHACIALYSEGSTLLVDPYENGQFGGRMAYQPVDVVADWVVCTHEHVDHAAVGAIPGSPKQVDEGRAGPFEIARFPLAHDEYGGRRRGGFVDAVRIRAEGLTVLHLSDVGESPPAAFVEAHRGVDVLLVPTGGNFTIGAAQAWEWVERLAPRIAVPIHYATSACTLPMRDVGVFSGWCDSAVMWNSHRFHVEETPGNTLIMAPRLI